MIVCVSCMIKENVNNVKVEVVICLLVIKVYLEVLCLYLWYRYIDVMMLVDLMIVMLLD